MYFSARNLLTQFFFLSIAVTAKGTYFQSVVQPAFVSEIMESTALPTTGNPNVLITGGAGYIGSHTIVCLMNAGFDVTVVDNLVNSNEESMKRVLELVVRTELYRTF